MTIVLATYTTAPGKDGEVADLLRSYTALVLEEPGCLAFEVYRSVDDRHRFLLLEKYVDRAAFEAHQATEHFTEVAVNQIRPLLDDRSVEILDG